MISRLKQIRNELSLTQRQLADTLGCSKNNISMIETGKSALTGKNKMMLVKFLNVNPHFIETGRGPVLARTPRTELGATTGSTPDDPSDGSPGIAERGGAVPLYDINRAGGLRQILAPAPHTEPEGFIGIPNLPKCDGAAYHVGDSMYPILRSGDIVLYRALTDPSEIFWGDMYLVSVSAGGSDYVTVCYLDRSPSPGRAVMRGASPGRSETEIDITRITALAFVVATVRLNTAK